MKIDFPTLEPSQIECKVKKVTGKGALILLYKTARVDMDMLDKVVGPMNWRNSYRDIDGVLHCSIDMWDENKSQWVSKEDCGIESRADDEGNEKKGEASDAFKRAGFRWGIGRELYSAPVIFVRVPTVKDARGNFKLKNPFQKFFVREIAYDNSRKICQIVIVDDEGQAWFTMGKKSTAPTEVKPEPQPARNAAPAPKPKAETPPASEAPAASSTIERFQAYVTQLTSGQGVDVKRKVAAIIKQHNGGSNNYRAITDEAVCEAITEALKTYEEELNQQKEEAHV